MKNLTRLIILIILSIPVSIMSFEWSKPVVIIDRCANDPALAVDPNDHLHLVFASQGTLDPKRMDIFYSYFGGQVWSIPLNLSNSTRESWSPRIAADALNVVHVLWQDTHLPSMPPGPADLYYRFQQQGIWSNALSLDQTYNLGGHGGYTLGHPALDQNQRLHFVWQDSILVKYTYLKQGKPTAIQSPFHDGLLPDVHVDRQNRIHLAYIDVPRHLGGHAYNRNNVFYSTYSTSTGVWTDSVMVYNNPNQYSRRPQITTDQQGRIHILWLEDQNLDVFADDIYHSFSEDQGRTWSPAENVTRAAKTCSKFKLIVDLSGILHLVWDQADLPNQFSSDQVWHTFYENGSWSAPERISVAGKNMGGSPDIAVDHQNYLHVVWIGREATADSDLAASWKIYYRATRPMLAHTQEPPQNMPENLQLFQNYPNPFNCKTTIYFSLPHSTWVTLRIFDLRGKCVKTLLSMADLSAGMQQIFWNGTNDRDQMVSSGIYWYQLLSPQFQEIRKMMLLK